MTNLEQQIKEWHDRKYGIVKLGATYSKLLEEVGELGEALMNHNPDGVFEEAGDIAFVLCHIIRQAGANPSLESAIRSALMKCEEREKV